MPEKIPYDDPMAMPGPIPETQAITPEIVESTPKDTATLDEKELKSWWEKIDSADNTRKDSILKVYKKAIDYVKGKQFDNETPDEVVVNYIASTFWIIKNYIYANTPEYKATGKNPIGEVTSPIAEMALNYYTKEADADEENGLAILDSLMCGDGIVLDILSTDIIYGLVPKKESDYPVQTEEDKEAQSSDDSPKEADRFEYAEYIKKSKPVTFRISPYDFIMDPEAKSFKRARWCGRWIRKKTPQDVISNDKYRQECRTKIEQLTKNTDGKTIDLVEIQVKRILNGEPKVWRLILCSEIKDDYLYYAEEQYQVEGFNYSVLQLKKLGDDAIGMAEFLNYKPIQDLINQVHSKIWEQLSKSMTQPIVNEDMLTRKGKTALLAGKGVITVKTGMNPASLAIAQAETSKVHPDLWRYEQITANVFRVTSGVSEAMRAGVQAGAQTLGELNLIQGGTNVIMGGYAKELKRFLLTQGKKRLHLIRQLPVADYIPIAGYKDKVPKEFIEGSFLRPSTEYITGDYDIDLDINTMKQQDEMKERAEIKDMIATLAQVDPMLRQEGKRVKISKLVEDWITTKKRFNVDEYMEDMNLRSPDYENLAFLTMATTGQVVPVMPQEGEDLEEHAKAHQEFMAGPLKSTIPTEIWTRVVEPHLAMTLQKLEEKKMLVQRSMGKKSK